MAQLYKQVEEQQEAIDRLNKSTALLQQSVKAGSQKTSTSNTATLSPDKKATNGNRRITTSAKVNIENRYVYGETGHAAITQGPAGTVGISLTINCIGLVGCININRASTISDEEIIDVCKEAAFRTRFE